MNSSASGLNKSKPGTMSNGNIAGKPNGAQRTIRTSVEHVSTRGSDSFVTNKGSQSIKGAHKA